MFLALVNQRKGSVVPSFVVLTVDQERMRLVDDFAWVSGSSPLRALIVLLS